MKILYIANIRMPTEKAHGIQIMETLHALAQMNLIKTTLLVPRRVNQIIKDPFEYYGIEENFKIVRLPTIDLLFLPFFKKLWFFIESIVFANCAFWYVLFSSKSICYTRDVLVALYLSFLTKPFFYEIHMKI